MPLTQEKREQLNKEIDNLFAKPQKPSVPKANGNASSYPPAPPTNPAQDDSKRIKDKIMKAFEEASSLYAAEQFNVLQDKTLDLFRRNPAAIEGHADYMLNTILPERKIATKHFTNVKRQEEEIRNFELKPGQINNMAGYLNQIREGDDSEVRYPWSFIGGSDKEIKSIIENDKPKIHNEMPRKDYRNLVFDCRQLTLDEVKVNDKKLDVFLKDGRHGITAEEEAQTKKRSKALNRVSNLAEYAGDKLHRLVGFAGKDLLSHSKAVEDPRYKQYLARRNEMLARMLSRLGPNAKDPNSYLNALKKVNDALGESDDLMDQATFAKVQKMISDEMEKEESVSKAELERLNKEMQKLNDNMLAGLQGQVSNEDNMWKYRVVQAFLILTPLGAFSVFGHVFSYIDPLSELFGPLFDSSIGMGDAMGQMVKSGVLGPFGKIADLMGVDDATSWLLNNTPIVSDLLDIVDFATDNEIVGGLFAAAAPMISSPLLPIGIAGLYSAFRIEAELDHRKKTNELLGKQDKEMKDLFDKFDKERIEGRKLDKTSDSYKEADEAKPENLGLKKRVTDFVNRRFEAMRGASFEAKLAAFVANPDSPLDIFNALEVTEGNKKVKISDLRAAHNNSPQPILKVLMASDDKTKAEVMNKFLLLEAVSQPGKTAAENLAEFKKVKPEAVAELCKKQTDKLNQEFILKMVKAHPSVTSIQTDPAKKLADYEKQIKDLDRDHILKMYKGTTNPGKDVTPSPNVSSPEMTPLTRFFEGLGVPFI